MSNWLNISPKVLVQGLVTLLAIVAVAVISYLLTPDGTALYATWHPLAVVALQAALPAALGAAAGYLKADPLRRRGELAAAQRAQESLADFDAVVRASGARRALREAVADREDHPLADRLH